MRVGRPSNRGSKSLGQLDEMPERDPRRDHRVRAGDRRAHPAAGGRAADDAERAEPERHDVAAELAAAKGVAKTLEPESGGGTARAPKAQPAGRRTATRSMVRAPAAELPVATTASPLPQLAPKLGAAASRLLQMR